MLPVHPIFLWYRVRMSEHEPPRPRIVHVLSGDLWAGAEVMAFNLLRRLNGNHRIEVSVVLLNEGRLAQELRRNGVQVYVIDENRYSFPTVAKKIRNFLCASPPDLIHSHRYKENLLVLAANAMDRRVQLVATQHGLPEFKGRNFCQRLKSSLNFLALSRAFTTVAVSRDVADSLIKRYGLPRKKLAVIHNGIEPPPTCDAYPITRQGKLYIGSSGRMFPVKDYPLMVHVARAVNAVANSGVQFQLAGDGPEQAGVKALVEKYSLHRAFSLRGRLDNMNDFYRGLDIYLNTSTHEGIPMTILEAMSHGLPVVAPGVGGIPEIISNGVEGFLIKGRDPYDFASKCISLCKDERLRRAMSKAAREKVNLFFSAEKMALGYLDLYRRLLPDKDLTEGSSRIF